MNAAYKHLEEKLRIGELTLGQWVALFVGAMTAVLWATKVSPFGGTVTLFTACYVGGLPAAAIFLAATSDIDIFLLVRSAIRWRRTEGRHVAGGGHLAKGYVIRPEPVDDRTLRTGQELTELNLGALWDA